MHEDHPVFEAPTNPDISIWRYMDLAKFLSLLEDEALFFARSDMMSDKFEGSTTRKSLEFSRGYLGPEFDELQRTLSVVRQNLKEHTYLNCWHMSEYESAAMWSLYQVAGHGIAVRSTYRQFRECLRTEDSVYIGVVKYVDFDSEVIPEGNTLYPYIRKRRSFEFEREIRGVLSHPGQVVQDGTVRWGGESAGPPGKSVPVDLDRLVNTVYIAPDAPRWFARLVQSLLARYGRSWVLKRSDLAADPIY